MRMIDVRGDLQTWLAGQIRDRVVGPDAPTRHAELFDTDEPGWFDEDAPIRRVHSDGSMFIGGMRAILFQSLHPLPRRCKLSFLFLVKAIQGSQILCIVLPVGSNTRQFRRRIFEPLVDAGQVLVLKLSMPSSVANL